MRSIYSYKSYRQFLFDFYSEEKKRLKSFTYEKFSQKAGLKARNHIKLVVDGKKNLSLSSLHLVAGALDLNLAEYDYFEALVLFEQASLDIEKTYYSNRLKKIKKEQKTKKREAPKELLARWYVPALLIAFDGRNENEFNREFEHEMIRKLKLPKSAIQQMLKTFIDKKWLVVEKGQYKITDQYTVIFDQKKSNLLCKSFLNQQLELSQTHLKKNYEKDAKFFSYTLTLDPKKFPRYVEQIDSFIDELIGETNQDPARDIAQLNVQFFPISGSLPK